MIQEVIGHSELAATQSYTQVSDTVKRTLSIGNKKFANVNSA